MKRRGGIGRKIPHHAAMKGPFRYAASLTEWFITSPYMTREQETALRNFEARVRQLMSAHAELLRENVRLQGELKACRGQLEEANKEIEQQKRNYALLKTARMIEVSGEDVKASKARIAKLIREVDKCIALLDV